MHLIVFNCITRYITKMLQDKSQAYYKTVMVLLQPENRALPAYILLTGGVLLRMNTWQSDVLSGKRAEDELGCPRH